MDSIALDVLFETTYSREMLYCVDRGRDRHIHRQNRQLCQYVFVVFKSQILGLSFLPSVGITTDPLFVTLLH